jgi:hypothetical protein
MGRIRLGVALVGAELVVIVVAGDILVGGQLLIVVPEPAEARRKGAEGSDAQPGGPDEVAPVPVERLVSDF